MSMKLLIMLSLLLTSVELYAAKLSKELSKKDLVLKGSSLIEVTIFKIDVYVASFYVSSINGDNTELLELDYKTDVKKKYSIEGWEEGFKNVDRSRYREAINWIYRNTPNVIKGDKFSIERKGNLVWFFHNGILLSEIKDELVSYLALLPWVGDKPIDQKIKNELLGL